MDMPDHGDHMSGCMHMPKGCMDMGDPQDLNSCNPDSIGYQLHIGFTHILVNGKSVEDPASAKIDQKTPIRLRIINAGSMTHFQLRLGVNALLVATDGHFVKPIRRNKDDFDWIATGQRLDYIIYPRNLNELHAIFITPELLAEDSSNLLQELLGTLILYKSSSEPYQKSRTDAISSQFVPQYLSNVKEKRMQYQMESQLQAFLSLPFESYSNIRQYKIILTGQHGFRGINGTGFLMMGDSVDWMYSPNPNPLKVKFGERVDIVIENHSEHGHSMVRSLDCQSLSLLASSWTCLSSC